jgi:signal peptidase I
MSKFKLSFITFLSLILFTVSCSEKTMETINDPDTKPQVEKVQTITSDMIVIHYMADTMDRGNHDFFDKDVVIDTKHYQQKQFKRGDIVALKREDGYHSLYRVVGLPNERVKIEKGQIFIDGKKLGTFYGRYHHAGMDLDAYKKLLETSDFSFRKGPNGKQYVENHIKYIEELNEDEVTVSEGYVFLIGDDWNRSGTIMKPQEDIIGKVLGYKQ